MLGKRGWRAAVVTLGVLVAARAQAQSTVTINPVQDLNVHSPETWAMRFYTAMSQVTGFGAPPETRLFQFFASVEGTNVPYLTERQRTVGFDGTKEENFNTTHFFGRVSAGVGLPADFSLGLHWTPPVVINGTKANLLAATIARPIYSGYGLRVGLTAAGQVGWAKGSFTCSQDEVDAGLNSTANPFSCEEASDDEVLMRYVSLELAASYKILPLAGLEPFVSILGSRFWNKFEVNALYDNIQDNTQLVANTWNGAFTAGLSLPIGHWMRFAAEFYYQPIQVKRRDSTTNENDPYYNARGLLEFHIP